MNFVEIFGIKNLESPGLSCGTVCKPTFSHSDTIPDVTDRHRHDDGIYHTNIASCGKNSLTYAILLINQLSPNERILHSLNWLSAVNSLMY